ncbi:hypothetical protein [Pedobacter steynii]
MAENEKTSLPIASYASEILKWELPMTLTEEQLRKLKAVAGSALTQAPDKLNADTLAARRATLKGLGSLGKKPDLSPSLFKALQGLKIK